MHDLLEATREMEEGEAEEGGAGGIYHTRNSGQESSNRALESLHCLGMIASRGNYVQLLPTVRSTHRLERQLVEDARSKKDTLEGSCVKRR